MSVQVCTPVQSIIDRVDLLMEAINEATQKNSLTFSGLSYSDDPDEDAYFRPVKKSVGKRYIKLITAHGSNASVYCFIDRNNGNIFKAASWSAPAKGARGNVKDPRILEIVRVMGYSTGWLYRR